MTANLTPSIDPSLSLRAVRNFAGHPQRSPLDTRMAGLFEVVCIVHRIAQDSLQRPLAQTGTGTLRRVNEELEEWERRYLSSTGPSMESAYIRKLMCLQRLITRGNRSSRYIPAHYLALVPLGAQLVKCGLVRSRCARRDVRPAAEGNARNSRQCCRRDNLEILGGVVAGPAGRWLEEGLLPSSYGQHCTSEHACPFYRFLVGSSSALNRARLSLLRPLAGLPTASPAHSLP